MLRYFHSPTSTVTTNIRKGVTLESLAEAELYNIPLHRLGTGKDQAGAVLWLASESGAYVTGQLINVNGGVFFS